MMTKVQNGEYATQGYGRQHNSGAPSTVKAFFVGSLLGAATGILFAPRSGQDTRVKIKQKAKNTLDKGQDKIGRITDKAKDKVEKTGEKVSEVKQAMSNEKDQQSKTDRK